MTEPRTPSPQEAHEQLALVAQSRRATARATQRPAWIDAVLAVTLGGAFGLVVAGHLIAAVVVVAPGIAVAIGAQWRLRHRGELADGRAFGSRVWKAMLMYGVASALAQFRPTDAPWYPPVAGLVIAAMTYAGMRWEERYRFRRLSAGDHGRYDLT